MQHNPYSFILQTRKRTVTPAKEALQKAYLELLKEYGYEEVNVKNLCQISHVARSTFYAYYSNTEEILAEMEDNLIRQLLDVNNQLIDKEDSTRGGVRVNHNTWKLIDENQDCAKMFLSEKTDDQFMKKCKNVIRYQFWNRLDREHKSRNSEFFLEAIAAAVMSIYILGLERATCERKKIILETDIIMSSIMRAVDLYAGSDEML